MLSRYLVEVGGDEGRKTVGRCFDDFCNEHTRCTRVFRVKSYGVRQVARVDVGREGFGPSDRCNLSVGLMCEKPLYDIFILRITEATRGVDEGATGLEETKGVKEHLFL